MRDWVRRTGPRFRTQLIIAANVVVTVTAILIFNALRPLPPVLTQRDVDNAVSRSIQNAPPQPSWQSVVYEAIRPSVVIIEADVGTGSKRSSSLGTGIVIQDTGVILTCLHVVGDADQVKVVFADGSDSPALVTVRHRRFGGAVHAQHEVVDLLARADGMHHRLGAFHRLY